MTGRPRLAAVVARLPTQARRLATGGVALWVGTLAFSASTVILLAVVGRHPGEGGFDGLSALLALLSVGSLVPVGVMLRSAALVADGRSVPTSSRSLLWGFVLAGLAFSPWSGELLHVPAAAILPMVLQLLVAIRLASQRGVLLATQHFTELGINLAFESLARILLASLLGLTLGLPGVAVGCCLATVVAMATLPTRPVSTVPTDRPVTSLFDTSLALVLVGLFVQLDVLLAPSALSTAAAKRFDVAAVPSKGVYLALLAAGPLVFPFVRRSGARRLIVLAAAGTVVLGLVATGLLLAARPLIGAALGQAEPSAVLLLTLGTAMALAGGTAVLVNAAVARGVARPWPAVALAIVGLTAYSRSRPGAFSFALAMLVAQAAAAGLSVWPSLYGELRANADSSSTNDAPTASGSS